jgi:hypothetical protein
MSTVAPSVSAPPGLSRAHTFGVEIDARGPLRPTKPAYDPIRSIESSGFSFVVKDLLHAIGCKTASLPMNEEDECLRCSYLFTRILDLQAPVLCFASGNDSDLQTPRSQELGIGMMCLIAHYYWQIPWDQLGPIPAPGKRFDYRGQNGSIKAIFESKGTKYSYNQPNQIVHGLEKKEEHHARGENYDVELVVSTHVGMTGDTPRILTADPEYDFNALAFGPDSNNFYRIRHYARVMQFIGAPATARRLYLESNALLGRGNQPPRGMNDDFELFDEYRIGPLRFLGHWFDKWVPEGSVRFRKYRDVEQSLRKNPFRTRVFQGLFDEFIGIILESSPTDIQLFDRGILRRLKDVGGEPVSAFDDGSIFVVEEIN